MAGSITHLVIANRIIEKLPKGIINNEALFYAGSIAPDAIHARENYKREFKKKTHFTSGIKGSEFHLRENLNIYHKRINKFIADYIDLNDANHDLYRGYIVHILTDELFNLIIREEFAQDMKKIGIDQNDRLFFTNLMKDNDNNNIKLAIELKNLKYIFTLLENIESYEIKEYLTENELRASKNWVINKFTIKENQIPEAKYIKYIRCTKFIEEATDDIICRLTEGVQFKKVF